MGLSISFIQTRMQVGANKLGALFVDLFVKDTNTRAVNYYKVSLS